MGQSTTYEFDVTDSIPFKPTLSLLELQQQLETNNPQLLVAQKNITIAQYTLKEQKAERWPTINFNSTYNFNSLDNKAVVNPFQPLFSRNKGFNYIKHTRQNKKMVREARRKNVVDKYFWELNGKTPRYPRGHTF